MAADTVKGWEILFWLANHTGEMYSSRITAVSASPPTSITCALHDETEDSAYNYGIAREVNGTIMTVITAYTGATKVFTVSPGLTGAAVGDLFEWAWHDPRKYSAAWQSINDAIYESREVWGREVKDTRASATLTFTANTYIYALPAAVNRLLRVGIQPTANDPVWWFDPLDNWRVDGEPGAYQLAFLPGFRSDIPIAPAWSSSIRMGNIGQTMVEAFTSYKILLHYLTWETAMTADTDTTRLPIWWFYVAAEKYLQWLLANGSPKDLINLNVQLPQIQREAARARARLGTMKPKFYTAEYDF